MTVTLAIGDSNDLAEGRWVPMIALSLLAHAALFIFIFIAPGAFPSGRHVSGIVYEVDLVEIQSSGRKGNGPGKVVEEKGKATIKKDTFAKRISSPKQKPEPVSITKRSVETKAAKPETPILSSSQLIDKAISRIEKKVKAQDGDHVEKAISRLEKEVGEEVGEGHGQREAAGTGQEGFNGLTIRIYQMEVETRIKDNWSYPVAAQDQKKLEAIVVIKVKQDGTILESWFKDKSSDIIFDQSVLKAIEKSNPLPPFPEGYSKSYDEIEITFNLKDLEDN